MDTVFVVKAPPPSERASVTLTAKAPPPEKPAAVANLLSASCAAATILTVLTPCATTVTDPLQIHLHSIWTWAMLCVPLPTPSAGPVCPWILCAKMALSRLVRTFSEALWSVQVPIRSIAECLDSAPARPPSEAAIRGHPRPLAALDLGTILHNSILSNHSQAS